MFGRLNQYGSWDKILEILETSDPLESKLSQLVAQANEAGGLDNITVLVIHFDEQKEENQW